MLSVNEKQYFDDAIASLYTAKANLQFIGPLNARDNSSLEVAIEFINSSVTEIIEVLTANQ